MDMSKYTIAPHTSVPDSFIPAIGRVMVEHAYMDQKVQAAICALGNIDYSAAVSFLSEILMTSKRAEILKNFARTQEPDFSSLIKVLVLGDLVKDLSVERNTIAHSIPYWTNADATEIGYFKEENKTHPQIAVAPPYVATVSRLNGLADQMMLVSAWLGMLQKNWLPEGIDPIKVSSHEFWSAMIRNPTWSDDKLFPWPDKFAHKADKERNKPQNSQRMRKSQPPA